MRTTTAVRALALALPMLIAGASLAAQAPERGRGPQEGIKVHGHWTIDIKNADGSLVKRHEFQNALQPSGGVNLAKFLARLKSPGLWAVLLYGSGGAGNCLPSGVPCVMSENKWAAPAGGDLTVSVPASGPNEGKLVLTGSFTSPDARTFTSAISGLDLCAPGAPGCPNGEIGGNFTQKTFAPIAVQAGQIVQVTVVISFS